VIVDPLCEVEGEVSVFDSTGSGAGTPRGIAFAGRGYHDHRYGTRPLPLEGFGGRVLLEDRALAFEQIGGRDVAMLLTIGKDTTVDISSVPAVGEGANLNLGMIHLSRPTVLESDRFQTVLTYQARVGGETGVALCRKLHRRRWAPLT